MKNIIKLLVVCLNFIHPVTLNVHDDSEKIEYLSGVSDLEVAKPKITSYKKYSYNSQKNSKLVNERIVDSHFAILRASPVTNQPVTNIDLSFNNKNMVMHEPSDDNSDRNENLDMPIASRTRIIESDMKSNQYDQNQRSQIPHEQKSLNIEALIANHVPSPSKKYPINLVNSQYSYYDNTRVPSVVKDKTLHKNKLNRNYENVAKKHNDKRITDKTQIRFAENKKRDAPVTHSSDTKRKSNVLLGNIIKDIRKDMGFNTNINGHSNNPFRIGNYESIMDRKTPYGLFYRTGPDNMEQDFFSKHDDVMHVEDPVNPSNDKDKFMMNIDHELSERIARNVLAIKSKKNKNYSAFQNR